MHNGRCSLCQRRASDFVVALLHRLHDDQQVSLSTAASDAYYKTIYNNHTWYTSAAFIVVLKVQSETLLSQNTHVQACIAGSAVTRGCDAHILHLAAAGYSSGCACRKPQDTRNSIGTVQITVS